MPTPSGTLTYNPEKLTCEVRGGAGDDVRVFGITNYAESPEAGTATTLRAIGDEIGNLPTPGGPGTFSLTIDYPRLGSEAHDTLDDAGRNNTPVNFRVVHEEEEIFAQASNVLMAVATTGVVTFSGTGAAPIFTGRSFTVGHAFKLEISGTTHYARIGSISKTGVVTLYPKPTTAISTPVPFSIVKMGWKRGYFVATPQTPMPFSFGAEQAVTSTLTFTPSSVIPKQVFDHVALP